MERYYKRVFAKPATYKGITFRSTIEKDFAMFLDGKIVRYKGVNYYHNPIKWEYELNEFELIPQEKWIDRTELDTKVKKIVRNKTHTLQRVIYTPDFYLPEYNLFVEVKGRQFYDDLFRLRFRLFKHKYPNKAIWLLTSHEDFILIDKIINNMQNT